MVPTSDKPLDVLRSSPSETHTRKPSKSPKGLVTSCGMGASPATQLLGMVYRSQPVRATVWVRWQHIYHRGRDTANTPLIDDYAGESRIPRRLTLDKSRTKFRTRLPLPQKTAEKQTSMLQSDLRQTNTRVFFPRRSNSTALHSRSKLRAIVTSLNAEVDGKPQVARTDTVREALRAQHRAVFVRYAGHLKTQDARKSRGSRSGGAEGGVKAWK